MSIPAQGFLSLDQARGGRTTVFRSLAMAQKHGGACALEFHESYLPVASVELQKQRDEAERLALMWAERVGELDRLLAGNRTHRPPPTEQPRKKPRKSDKPRRVRCPSCRALWRPGEHDTERCAADLERRTIERLQRESRVLQTHVNRTGSGYPGGGVPR